jgi:hypothetical protein
MANPVLETVSGSIGIHRHDNYFAFKFSGSDPDEDSIEYVLYDSENQLVVQDGITFLIPRLTLNPNTGWFFGVLPTISSEKIIYNFGVAVRKVDDPGASSEIKSFSLTVLSSSSNFSISWLSDTNLGTIENGAASTASIQAESTSGAQLQYDLYDDESSVVYQRLPQGLTLNLDGTIQGRVAFINSDYDGSSLFQTYTFTARARDSLGAVSATKTFNITVRNSNTKPYENLYLISLISDQVKLRLENLETETIPFGYVYRPNDPFFGVQKKLRILIAQGLEPKLASDYLAPLSTNHYKKLIKFREPQLARALDANNKVLYEVIYLRVNEDLENLAGVSVSETLPIATGPISANSNYQDLIKDNIIEPAAEVLTPNSIQNMRNRMIESIGQANVGTLPAWMTSRQTNGVILGWIPAAVLCYIKPGFGQAVLSNMRKFDFQKNNLSFFVDRYVWDQNLSYLYDKTLEQFLDISVTTFDSNSTLFDGAGTVFMDFVETSFPFSRIAARSYEAPEKNDKYLVFPRHGVLK